MAAPVSRQRNAAIPASIVPMQAGMVRATNAVVAPSTQLAPLATFGSMASSASPKVPAPTRSTEPLIFPVEAEVPETRRHLELRTLLFEILRRAFGAHATVGSDQFVYWNAADPRRCLAPDVFVRVGEPDRSFDSWKTWERGAPQVAIEIISESDSGALSWEEKLGRYQELGVMELLRFDERQPAGKRIRRFERIDERLIERETEAERAPSSVLPCTWLVAAGAGLEVALRAVGEDGLLLPTPAEAAEKRVVELEAELSRRG